MGALIFVLVFMVMIMGGFFAVHFIDDCIKLYERVFGE
ncbi:hypothetical protein Plant_34 [Bacillus phage poppyseed]|uniref:Uncharacterized protein n=2 Tax=Bacillus phage Page TaxID=1406786 RepID=U5PVZ5_9CAUD|nr:hypothetical protein Page_34 [Bacillus phage Page]AGY47956.1 hypothetical protein Page_34 [Bacillus phage Page]AGY48051.1 hypothetical protein Plant_34 [Bacillus phage poppyseed]